MREAVAGSMEGRGIPLPELRTSSRGLTEEEFRERYGNAFLLYLGTRDASRSLGSAGTVLLAGEDSQMPTRSPCAGLLVFCIQKTGRSRYSAFISVGRDDHHDLVLADESVSRFHAFITENGAGRLLLLDACSRNGTFVDDERVAHKELGSPVELRPGARVRFGSVETTFLRAKELHRLVSQLAEDSR